jgi:2-C-methyl-D-erythritol 4-phosphate cytidylyltransferase/2-C-methyl-D-erythritol 2,4-cyclodiphosphate synthase
LIHDAARPFVDSSFITRLLTALETHPGAIAAEQISDTIKKQKADGTIATTIERSGLWRAQTPQGFKFGPILAAHRKAASEARLGFTDDAALAEWAGLDVALVASSGRNVKLTTADDLRTAECLLRGELQRLESRTGTGFDVHRFCPGDHVWLAGVKIAHDRGLEGHSDADAPLHALTDAILGALGEGDIGQHFPPTDPQWRGAASSLFVRDAARRVAARGGRVSNVDLTILAESPRIGPHRTAMCAAIGDMLGIAPNRVGLKATTTEGLGFIGRREGVAAMASATILLPL